MALALQCPYCRHRMSVKSPRAGVFAPRCPQCEIKFQVEVSDDLVSVEVTPLARRKGEEAVTPDIAAALGIEVPEPVARTTASASSTVKAKGLRRSVSASAQSLTSVASSTSAPTLTQDSDASGHRQDESAHGAQLDDSGASAQSWPGLTVGPMTGTSLVGERLVEDSHAGGSFAGEGAVHDDVAGSNGTALPQSNGTSDRMTNVSSNANAQEAVAGSGLTYESETVGDAAQVVEPLDLLGKTLGGFEVIKKLGAGGMGSVFLARQVSLDRNVAVKVLNPDLATDPALVSRFTREAYAAAQLVHHNVVQIYDIGEQKNIHYFGMEFVEGQTLSGVVRESGKLDPEVAAGDTLQAARGLKFAHDHGMVHRDIKPDNLLLNDQGIVKVADLGLVKTGMEKSALKTSTTDGAADRTSVGMSMGTPAYMAPEQARDAAHVDARADIYSLGCTLFDLLTGRPPFPGRSAIEVMTKHQSEAPPPVERLNQRVPKVLSAVVSRMMAKRPEDRFGSMGEVVRELEDFLGVDGSKPFSPREEHAATLGVCVGGFNNAKWSKVRAKLIPAFFAVCGLLIVTGFTLTHSPWLWGGGFVGFTVLTFVSYIVLAGITQRTHLFMKLRQLVFGARLIDWLKYLFVGVAGVALLVLVDLHWVWLGFLVASALVAAGFHFTVDLLLSRERQEPIRRAEALFKMLRLKGLDEDSLRQFVCKFSGDRWEEFYETLFGYPAKLHARQVWVRGEGAKQVKTHAGWRDRIVRWIDQSLEARKAEREARHLAKVEARKLRAEGVSDADAKKKARRAAERMVDKATELRDATQQRSAATVAPQRTISGGATVARTTLNADSVQVVRPGYLDDEPGGDSDERVRQSYIQRKYGGWNGLILGSQTRFVLGAVLLLGFGVWLYQNKSVPVTQIIEHGAQTLNQTHDTLSAEALYTDPGAVVQAGEFKAPTRPLDLPGVPKTVLNLFSTYNCGIAGALLVLSCLFSGLKLGFFIIPGALFMFAGHLIPGFPGASQLPYVSRFVQTDTLFPVTLLSGGLLVVLGLVFARK